MVSSFGKTLHATGWKVGYCVAPPALTQELRKVHQFVQFVVATPLQAAIADFMLECPQHVRGLPGFYQRKRDHFAGVLGRTRFRFTPAAQHVLPARGLLGDQRPARHRVRARAHDAPRRRGDPGLGLLARHPPASERLVRFCFAKHEATLDAAAARLEVL